MVNLPENVSGVSTSIDIASESTNIHDISLSVASASDDFELDSCEWSENPRDEDAESLSSANWSREFDSDIFNHPERALHLDFRASPDPKTPRITSTPKKKTDATPLTSLLPTTRFYSQISKVKDKDPLNKACVGESVVSWNFLRVMQTEGCAERCITMVHELSEYDVLSAHAQFDVKTPQEQNQWILEYFVSHCPSDADGNRDAKNITYILAGRTVCLNIWLRVLGISVSRYYRLRSDFLENGGAITQLQVTKRSRSLSPKTMKAVAWMEHYFNRIGDKRPDKDGIYLPTCLVEKKIYEIMVDELFKGDESKSVCFSQFNKLYRVEFKNVTIPKECRFSKCDLCTLVKIEISKPTTNKFEKDKLKEILKEHLDIQEQERRRYYSNRQLGIEDPQEYLSIILDGMDQNKTNLPSLVRIPKSCQNLWTLRTHLTGVLVHGTGSFCYFDFLQWSHDCNLTITCLLHTLNEISKQRPLPSKLLLQMDNCVRENKNKYVYGFLSWLVEKKIFAEIELGFLMVGHTHEDIDQHFSCLSRYLRKHSAITSEDMEECVKASNKHVSEVSTLTYVYDVRGWISDHLEEIRYHTQPHIFLFKRNPTSGRSQMFYKHWSHDSWEPSGSSGLTLLKSLPPGIPSLVMPSLEKQDIPQMKRDLPKYDAAGVCNPDAILRWEKLLAEFPTKYGGLPESDPPWIVDALQPSARAQESQVSVVQAVLPERVSQKVKVAHERRQIELGKHRKTVNSSSNKTPSSKRRKSAISFNATEVQPEAENKTLAIEEKKMFPLPSVGDYIALRCFKYKDFIPQIAKVRCISESDVEVEWLDGSYTGIWVPWKDRGKVIVEKFPKRAVIGAIVLTASMRLKRDTITALKGIYQTTEYV